MAINWLNKTHLSSSRFT